MARTRPMLSSATSSGDRPVLDISDDQWDELYELYGQDPSPPARSAAVNICENYLIWKRVELNALPVAAMDTHLKRVEGATAHFTKFAYGQIIPFDDAGRELNVILDDELKGQFYGMTGKEVSRFNKNKSDWQCFDESESMQVALSLNQLAQIGMALNVAVKKSRKIVDEKLSEKRSGWQSGQAFNEWLIQMRDWAKGNRFRHGMEKDSGPSSFAEFLFGINRRFPEDMRDTVASPAALAKRVKRVTQMQNGDK